MKAEVRIVCQKNPTDHEAAPEALWYLSWPPCMRPPPAAEAIQCDTEDGTLSLGGPP
jgi:hypothetical protein